MEPKQTLAPAVALFLFLAFLTTLVMYLSQQPPRPLPASAPPAEFSAEHAFRHVALSAHDSCDASLRAFATAFGTRYRPLRVGEAIEVMGDAIGAVDDVRDVQNCISGIVTPESAA